MTHHEESKGNVVDDSSACAMRWVALTRNEEFWIEVIRQASRDADPPPSLDRVRRLRAVFRG